MMSIASEESPVFTGEQNTHPTDSTTAFPKDTEPVLTTHDITRGVWGLIQAQISQIDFDYASYAELRLGEYFAWKREVDGSRAKAGEEMPLREKRWAQEA